MLTPPGASAMFPLDKRGPLASLSGGFDRPDLDARSWACEDQSAVLGLKR
jgi:hypothetical protein